MPTVTEHVRCTACGAEMLARTAAKTGGLCMPCATGTREEIEAGKRWAAARRALEAEATARMQRFANGGSPTLGEFLADGDPVGSLWQWLVRSAFRDKNEDVDRLSGPARALYLVQLFDAEVLNGGVSQYFGNTAGRFAGETVIHLREVGATRSAALLEEAIGRFDGGVVPEDREKRWEQLLRLEAADPGFLPRLDEAYYALTWQEGAPEDLSQLILEFMKEHAAERVVLGETHDE